MVSTAALAVSLCGVRRREGFSVGLDRVLLGLVYGRDVRPRQRKDPRRACPPW